MIDVRKDISKGTIAKKIFLPPENFSYGLKNRPSTPIKNVINFNYGNDAAQGMKRSYSQLFFERSQIDKLVPKVTKHYEKTIERNKQLKSIGDYQKKPYKIKKFLSVNSKVKENLKKFKTFYYPKISSNTEDIDNLINKVENEIFVLDYNENKGIML